MFRRAFAGSAKLANDFENRPGHSPPDQSKWRHAMNGKVVAEKVRQYRAIASLYRQTAAFRPDQKWSLLAQAFEYVRQLDDACVA